MGANEKHRLSCWLSPLIVTVLLFMTSQSSAAFMTFWWFGGAIHEAIVREALSPLGVKSSSLSMIVRGANSQDNPFSSNFAVTEHHAVNNNIQGAFEYFTHRTEQAVLEAADAYKDPKHRKHSLFVLGEGLHTLQDFYSHSNYLEWLLEKDFPLAPIDWQNIQPEVRTCYYQYKCLVDQEVVHRRPTSLRKLQAKYPHARFRSQEDYTRHKHDLSYEASLKYALEPGDLMHLELNKDNSSMLEGRILAPKYGKTFHELARQLAILDTARQWKKFENMLREHFKDRSALIIPALKGLTLPAITVTILPGVSVLPGNPLSGRLQLALKNSEEPMDVGIHVYVVETGQKIDYVVKKARLSTPDHSLEILFEQDLPIEAPAKELFHVTVDAYFTADPQFKQVHVTAVFPSQRVSHQ